MRGKNNNEISNGNFVKRRTFMKTVGVGAGLAVVGGTLSTGTASAQKEVKDIYEDGKADKNGNEPIDSILDDLAGPDTIVTFPPGEYLLIGNDPNRSPYNGFNVQSSYDGLELQGTDATLVQTSRSDHSRWLDIKANNFVMSGFEIDFNQVEYPGNIRILADDWEFKNISFEGKCPMPGDETNGSSSDARTLLRPAVATESGRGLIQDVYFNHGSAGDYEYSNRRAVFVGTDSKGHLVFNRCWFEMWGENTIYAKLPEGPLSIFNCHFQNTKDPIRAGAKTEVRNCTFVKNGPHPKQGWYSDDSVDGGPMRGINIEGSSHTPANSYDGPVYVSDCDFKHTYQSENGKLDQTGSCINSGTVSKEIDVQDCRMIFHGDRARSAIEIGGGSKTLERLKLENIQIENNYEGYDAIEIFQTPNHWETVSGVIGGTEATDGDNTGVSNNQHIRNNMSIGTPLAPDLTPPMPQPPASGSVPMDGVSLLRIDSTNRGRTDYSFEVDGEVWVAGDNDASIDLEPNGDTIDIQAGSVTGYCDTQNPDAQSLDTVNSDPDNPDGHNQTPVDAFLIDGELTSASSNGDAVWTLDGQQIDPSSIGDSTGGSRIIDDFEDGSVNEYSYPSDMVVNASSSAVHTGNYGLDLDGDTGNSGVVRSNSGDGLNAYPDATDEWEFWWNPQTLSQRFSVYFCLQSIDASQSFRVNFELNSSSNSYVEFQERGANGNSYLGSDGFGANTNTWYRTVVDGSAGDGTWTISVYDDTGSSLAEFTTSATQYTSYTTSGIAYYISGADQIYLDDITVR